MDSALMNRFADCLRQAGVSVPDPVTTDSVGTALRSLPADKRNSIMANCRSAATGSSAPTSAGTG
jgi:hypothetical protein